MWVIGRCSVDQNDVLVIREISKGGTISQKTRLAVVQHHVNAGEMQQSPQHVARRVLALETAEKYENVTCWSVGSLQCLRVKHLM